MRFYILCLLCLNFFISTAQPKKDTTAIKQAIDSLNKLLDHSVVQKDMAVLQKHYADDFFFQHATGKTDSKESWINSIQKRKTPYLSREHDSTIVELHQNVALITGILTVKAKEADKIRGYAVRYIRVYAYQKKTWQLISHHSTAQWDVKES